MLKNSEILLWVWRFFHYKFFFDYFYCPRQLHFQLLQICKKIIIKYVEVNIFPARKISSVKSSASISIVQLQTTYIAQFHSLRLIHFSRELHFIQKQVRYWFLYEINHWAELKKYNHVNEFSPNKAGILGFRKSSPHPIIFQEELIQCQYNFMQFLNNPFKAD